MKTTAKPRPYIRGDRLLLALDALAFLSRTGGWQITEDGRVEWSMWRDELPVGGNPRSFDRWALVETMFYFMRPALETVGEMALLKPSPRNLYTDGARRLHQLLAAHVSQLADRSFELEEVLNLIRDPPRNGEAEARSRRLTRRFFTGFAQGEITERAVKMSGAAMKVF